MQAQTKILVTGGTGFIGSHLVEKLIENKKNKVSVVDINLNPLSYFANSKLREKVKADLIDIRNRKKIQEYILNLKPDYVFHLAAEPIVEEVFDDPYRAFETNIMGTVNILEALRKIEGFKGVIVASSDKAYGKTTKPYDESFPLRGDHPYDVSKSAQDLISQSYHKSYGLPVVITRFGNVYGEGDFHFDRIVPGICKALLTKEKLLIRSDGTYVRDYIYVKDVVDGYVLLLKKINKISGEGFNFSSKDTFSVLDLITKAEKVLKLKIDYKILNIAKNEIPYQHLIDKKVRRLGWNNQYSLEKALPKVLKWYTKIL
jgi:CDP-glucose 4,6-dehydratase